ncbi:ArsR/SmtB family transcription factor [Hyphobacterium sp.]|uniref:ArsR/SmtB family transcription factor n=1 Tax=Hyphobacterium sp. TaxID=2004662 RepID=UPI003B52D988
MAYEKCLAVLSDPTRRAVFEHLRSGPAAAGDLARHFPVSRPAISQHLNTLLDAGLVEVERRGTQRIYSIRLAGLEALRSWLDGFWETALANYKEALERDEHGDQ